jgi:hypothetical protein
MITGIPMSLFDLVGVLGVFLCLCAYTLNILQRIDTTGVAYPAINAISSALILVSLVADFNLSSALMEASWLGVSGFAVVSTMRRTLGG